VRSVSSGTLIFYICFKKNSPSRAKQGEPSQSGNEGALFLIRRADAAGVNLRGREKKRRVSKREILRSKGMSNGEIKTSRRRPETRDPAETRRRGQTRKR